MSTLYFETPLQPNHDPPSKKNFRHTVLNYFLGKVTNAQYYSFKIKCVRAKNRRGGLLKPPPGSYRVKGSWTKAQRQAKLSAIISDAVKTEQSASATYASITFWAISKPLIQ